MKRSDLTPKQLAFANAILDGKGPSEAYKAAGYWQGSSKVVSVKAQGLLKTPAVADYIAVGRRKTANRAQMTRDDKLARLEERIRSGEILDRDGIKAVEVHNVMTGDNAPVEVNVFGLTDLLQLVRKS